jgi:hypothetical protein
VGISNVGTDVDCDDVGEMAISSSVRMAVCRAGSRRISRRNQAAAGMAFALALEDKCER